MKILTISDIIVPSLYSPEISLNYHDIDLVISCGDLPLSYLEYINSILNKRMYYVHGNHTPSLRHGYIQSPAETAGGINLHHRAIRDDSGLLLSGIEGCVLYNKGAYQYTQAEMWWLVWRLVPNLLLNKLFYHRYLDIFISHAPPWKIHDEADLPHQGIKAFRWLIGIFRPSLHIHGHTHVYNTQTITETLYKKTWVINTFGHRVLEIIPDNLSGGHILTNNELFTNHPQQQDNQL
jgi:uncharacterized protein